MYYPVNCTSTDPRTLLFLLLVGEICPPARLCTPATAAPSRPTPLSTAACKTHAQQVRHASNLPMSSFYEEPPGMFSCEPDTREGVHGYRCQCVEAGVSCACEVQEDQPSEMQMGLQEQIPWNDQSVAPVPAAPAAPPAPPAKSVAPVPAAPAAPPAKRQRTTAAAAPTHPAPRACPPPAKRQRHKKRGARGRKGKEGGGGKRGPSIDFEVACALERLVLDVAALDVVIPDPEPGSCEWCERDDDACERCYFQALDEVIASIPGHVASTGAGHASLVRGLRKDDPWRLESLRHITPPGGKCSCRCCANPLPFATTYEVCYDDACCGRYYEPAAWIHAVERAQKARSIARDNAPTSRPSREPPRPAAAAAAATQDDGDGDEQYWKDSWDDAEDHGGWGYAPAWAQNK